MASNFERAAGLARGTGRQSVSGSERAGRGDGALASAVCALRLIVSRLLLASACVAGPALASEPLPLPEGDVILEVRGAIGRQNVGDAALLDRTLLESFGTATMQTATPWTDGRPVFEGVPATRLLAALDASGEVIVARALNDYEVEIPVSDFERYDVLFALKQDGRYMRVRDKGPIWIVYPMDEHPEVGNQELQQRWIWQLKSLYVR